MRTFFILLLISTMGPLAVGCGEPEPDPKDSDTGTVETSERDADGDGFTPAEGDCDDDDDEILPGADETCNGVDDDCDGETDEDDAVNATTFYTDADGDGFGLPDESTVACDMPSGTSARPGDCDDDDDAIHPDAVEVCDGVDNDCDGIIDADDAVDAGTWYLDDDGDGYGRSDASTISCTAPPGFSELDGDCDDIAPEVYPGATEYCDGVDNDCDDSVDEAGAVDELTWYLDNDGDGWGNAASVTFACTQPSGYAADSGDCNDADATIHPGADEYCDGVDNDCDGTADEPDAVDAPTWYLDSDGDGYGDDGSATTFCTVTAGYVSTGGDCDDADSGVNPGATEWCNGVDDNCDGTVDEATAADASTWYADTDGDGYGDPATGSVACTQPTGFVADSSDCDDSTAGVSPGATEVCDGVDNDCDGLSDEPDAVGAGTWYADADGDGYGDPSSPTTSCTLPTGYVADDSDCDDSDGAINPGATEVLDGVDNDCDGVLDPEHCSDGSDNDGDGLIDCEDGDCASDSACTEDGYCDDGSDNDGDGTTDCEDDDCWADCVDLPYRAQVGGGTMNIVNRSSDLFWDIYTSMTGWGVANGTSWDVYHTAVATGVTGTLRVLPSAYWTGSPVASCAWSVDTVTMAFSAYGSDDGFRTGYDRAAAGRAGFTIEPGCGWSSSGFLPRAPIPRGQKAFNTFWWSYGFYGAWGSWYQGSVTDSSSYLDSSSWFIGTPGVGTWELIETTYQTHSYQILLNSGGDFYPSSGAWW